MKARVLAETEFARFAELASSLTDEEWVMPTDCPGWDVRRTARGRSPEGGQGPLRTPPPARYLPLPFGPPIGWAPLKYLLDVGFTRDVGAHRIDIHAAIGRPMHLTADHDGRHGVDGGRVEVDALDFIRTLSGRLRGTGVLNNALPV